MKSQYRKHVAERVALSIPPLPLDAKQTSESCKLLKNSPEGQEEILKKAFQEVAFRANRLREWMEYEPVLRNVDNRFSQFYSEVRNTNKETLGGRIGTIQNIWVLFQESDMIELELFIKGVQHINQALVTDPSNQVSSLISIGKKIQDSIDDLVFKDLRTNSSEFQILLKGLISKRRNIVEKEIRELCELTGQTHLNIVHRY
ncbi:hypothetical protein GNF10_31100 [Nostoc sp. UCD121]|nr:hypothetical protein [Nostoc sp. UCD120]MBC1280276.1 hypothetical protein [Nostoc sp. UCD121]MBC1299200.1 hypothetical protein [Nostoc sp. UCD122]